MSDRSSGISKEEAQKEIERWNALTPKQQAEETNFFEKSETELYKAIREGGKQ